MRVAVVGYGKMGHEVESVLRERRHEAACVDLGEPFPTGCVVGIDFTDPGAVVDNVQAALEAGARYVVGTTGWLERLPEVAAAVAKAGGGLVHAANFSLGVNLSFVVAEADAERAVRMLHHEFFETGGFR